MSLVNTITCEERPSLTWTLCSLSVFPLLRLSPTPEDDYNFNLDDNEGVCDLFDVQILNY